MASEDPRDPEERPVTQQTHDGPPITSIDRRFFLKLLGVAGVSAAAAETLAAEDGGTASINQDAVGVLVDTTRCMGCRSCEFACAKANDLPTPASGSEVLDEERAPSDEQWSVVNRYETDVGNVFVKKQCMHCLQPACAAACLTNAMHKTQEGPVVWREPKCMGCRFCMVSCPFDIPKFEYDSPVPKIQKCNLCWQRLQEGEPPACVANCPMKALTFGKRSELIEEAQRRILDSPDKYVHQIYGEHEVGGTSWLYLSAVPFEQLGFRTDLGTVAYPKLTEGFLYSVPIVLTLVPAFLLAVSNATKQENEDPSDGATNDRLQA